LGLVFGGKIDFQLSEPNVQVGQIRMMAAVKFWGLQDYSIDNRLLAWFDGHGLQ
jgi:hypothetical protein